MIAADEQIRLTPSFQKSNIINWFITMLYPVADPGFGIRGIVSRRGICGPLEVPSGSRAEP
jgi:hypothetical protein